MFGSRAGPALAVLAATVVVLTVAATAQESQRGAIDRFIGTLVRQTATLCPLSNPGDQGALDLCRKGLYADSAFRRGLAPVVLWGRPSPDGRRIKDTNL